MTELFGKVVAVSFYDDSYHLNTFLKEGASLFTVTNWNAK